MRLMLAFAHNTPISLAAAMRGKLMRRARSILIVLVATVAIVAITVEPYKLALAARRLTLLKP